MASEGKTEIFNISGMSCGHCVRAVQQAIEGAGAEALRVEVGSAEVRYQPESLRRDVLIRAIEEEGYQVVGG
jgi:copper chaperone